MSNILTDQLRLAEKIYASGILWFEHPLKAVAGCTQVVFRGDEYIGSVAPFPQRGQQVKVRQRDIIIRVYHALREHRLIGTISTKDKYKRLYDIPFALAVNDPVHVAREYFQEKDPAKQTIDALKANFERYATNFNHDSISNALQIIAKAVDVGIHIEQKGHAMFREDPQFTELYRFQIEARHRRERLQLEQDTQNIEEQIKRNREREQKDYEREELAKQNKHKREEDTRDHIHTISKTMRDVAVKEITDALKERIRESFERGRTLSQISDEYFALFGLFQDEFHIGLEGSILKSMFGESSIEYNSDISTHQTDTHSNPATAPSDSTNHVDTEPELEIVDLELPEEFDPPVN